MKGLTLSQKEQARLETLNRVLAGYLRVSEAALVLGVSERHTWRMLAAYRKDGAAAVAQRSVPVRVRRVGISIDLSEPEPLPGASCLHHATVIQSRRQLHPHPIRFQKRLNWSST